MGTIREELASQFRSLSVASAISMSVVFSIFAGVITGYYLDAWLFDGQSHWLTILQGLLKILLF
ncbi:MAG: AtpZ/AtpI family protein [Deltaproteobacteria bacterium]|nr:AtpZ/AtpI family protein [Deltaproteobacteria bacterium]